MDCVVEIKATLGESPVWSPEEKILYWVDLYGKKVHAYDTQTQKNATRELNDLPTALALHRKGHLLLALGHSLAFFDFKRNHLEPLVSIEPDLPDNRCNDGKCDRAGNFWIGTLNDVDFDKPTGTLYRFDAKHQLHAVEPNLVTSNGPAFSPDNSVIYVVESWKKSIFAYDFDMVKGTLSHRRLFATLGQDSEGYPDGLTVDREGFVWSAHAVLGKIVRYDNKGKIDHVIPLPVPRPSSCMFGGENLDTLYITTMRAFMEEDLLEKYPLSGSLFAIKVGPLGLPETPYRG